MKTIFASLAFLYSGAQAASTINSAGHCVADSALVVDGSTVTGFAFSVDIFAGDTGYYEVEGCGRMPTLAMTKGVEYTFLQTDSTNWYHPLGFAYEPDGALDGKDELETGVGNGQAPVYVVGGSDSDLDTYEGVDFSGGRQDWIDANSADPYHVRVTISSDATTELFYFCHIHIGMSGRIVVYDTDGTTPKVTANPVELYEYDFSNNAITDFDEECGTFNVSQFHAPDACPGKAFLCDDGSPMSDPSTFATCMQAIDCAMYQEMRVDVNEDPVVTFMHQMIPHHRNAINMVKILLKQDPAPASLTLSTVYGETDDGELINMLWDIYANQNAQITYMENWLRDNGKESYAHCPYDAPASLTAPHMMVSLSLAFLAFLW